MGRRKATLEVGGIYKVKYVRQWVKVKDIGDMLVEVWSQEHAGRWHDQRFMQKTDLLAGRKRKAKKNV